MSKTLWLPFILLVLALGWLSAPNQAQSDCILRPGINARSYTGPGTTFNMAGDLTPGAAYPARVRVIGTDARLWFRLEDGNWASLQQVTISDGCNNLPEIRSATSLLPPTGSPLAPADRRSPPSGARLLQDGLGLSDGRTMNNGEFQLEWYCEDLGYLITNDGVNWYCTLRNGQTAFQLLPADFDMVCQATYANPNAYAIQDGLSQVDAFRWRCYESGPAIQPTPTLIPNVDTIDDGDTVGGFLNASGFVAWQFMGERGDRVTISMSSNEIDSFLELYRAEGETGPELVRSDDDSGGGRNARINAFELATSERYVIVARGFSATDQGNFTLTLNIDRPLAPPPADDDTPGDGRLTYGSRETGTLQRGTSDEWTFQARAGDVVTIEMSSGDFDTYLRLLGPTGGQVADNDDIAYPDNTNSAIRDIELGDSGLYTILAGAYSPDARGTYTIALSSLNAMPAPDSSVLQYGDNVNATLQTGQADEWRFEGSSGDSVTISLRSSQFDTVLELVGPGNTKIAVNDDFDGQNSQIGPITLTQNGTHILIVRSFGGDTGGVYTLALTENTAPPGTVNRTLEYGDRVTANLINGIADRWTFKATVGDEVIIGMNSGQFDTYLELVGPNDNKVTFNDDFNGLNSQIGPYILNEAGTYTLVARGFRADATGEYTLALDMLEAVGVAGLEQSQFNTQTLDNTLAYGETVVATLTSGLQDEWTFTGSQGDTVTIILFSSAFDALLQLYDGSGQLIADNNDFDGLNAQIGPLTLPANGTFTILAGGVTPSAKGEYTLSIDDKQR